MFARELKVNLKSFVIWTGILLILFLIVFLMYPSLIASENMDQVDELLKVFPPEVLKAFNMDIAAIDTAFGWMKTEGFVFVLLITGVYSSILGTGILLKEESDKTIEYLNSLPVTRRQIVLAKVAAATFYIFSMILILGIFNYAVLRINEDVDKKQFVLLSITPLFSSLVIFALCLFISTFTHKTKKVFGIGLGVVFAAYFINVISEMSGKVKFLRFFSIFTLADVRNVITEERIRPVMIGVTGILFILLCILANWHYEKKELV